MKNFPYYFIGVLIVLLLSACRNDTILGSDLLDDDEIEVEFKDDIAISAKTVLGDSVLTFNSGNSLMQTYMMGKLEDGTFGSIESEIYFDAGITGNVVNPNFDDVAFDDIDSIVLVLSVDTLGMYGDKDASFDFEVFRLTESLLEIDTIYSDETFMHDMTSIGSLNGYVYDPLDTLLLREQGDTVFRQAQLRIHLDGGIAEELVQWVQDSGDSLLLNDERFSQVLNGFKVTGTSSSSAMMGVDLSSFASQTELSELAIYYKQDTLENRKYGFSVGLRKTSHFASDYTGSSVEEGINGGEVIGDSVLYVQSMDGVNIEFDLSNVQTLSDQALNYAELEFFVLDFTDNDLEKHPPIDILLASTRNDDGQLVIIEDIAQVNVPSAVSEVTENGETVWRYQIVMTRYIQDVINAVENGENLTISAILKGERPNRSVICGPNHSSFPSKLKLALTTP